MHRISFGWKYPFRPNHRWRCYLSRCSLAIWNLEKREPSKFTTHNWQEVVRQLNSMFFSGSTELMVTTCSSKFSTILFLLWILYIYNCFLCTNTNWIINKYFVINSYIDCVEIILRFKINFNSLFDCIKAI